MNSTLATNADLRGYGPDQIIRASFLASFSEPTRGSYSMVLSQWFAWSDEHNLRPSEAKRAHIELWARELDEHKGLMNSTIAGKLTAVCGMYRFAQMDGYLATNEGQWVKRPYVSTKSTTEPLTKAELLAILNTAEQTHPQDYALLCVGLEAGAQPTDMQHSLGHKSLRSLATYDHFTHSLERNSAHWVALSVEAS